MKPNQIPTIQPLEAQGLLQQGVPFFDVREVDEFDQARIPGTKLIPLSEFTARFGEIPKDQKAVIYCRSGNRSGQAIFWLANQGYSQLLNLEGGILSWYSNGLPLDTAPLEETYHQTHYTDLSPHQAQEWLDAATQIVDVREPYEFASGHVPGAVNIPLGQFAKRAANLPKDQKILVVCASGGRSSSAAEYLVAQGFSQDHVGNLEGGTYGWMSAGLAIER